MRTTYGETRGFPMTICLYQGSPLSTHLFALIMDELTAHIQENVLWWILFTDYNILVDESRDGVNVIIER